MTLVAFISGFFISGIILSPNEIENEQKMKSAIMCASVCLTLECNLLSETLGR